jgi:hypothetical protein
LFTIVDSKCKYMCFRWKALKDINALCASFRFVISSAFWGGILSNLVFHLLFLFFLGIWFIFIILKSSFFIFVIFITVCVIFFVFIIIFE